MSNDLLPSAMSEIDFEQCARLYIRAFGAHPWKEGYTLADCIEVFRFFAREPGHRAMLFQDRSSRLCAFWIGRYLFPFRNFVIQEVVVDPELQRKGIGRAVMAHVEATAENLGARSVSLATKAGTYIERFYIDLGYKPRACHAALRKTLQVNGLIG